MRRKKNPLSWIILIVLVFAVLGFFTPISSLIRNSFLSLTSPMQEMMFTGGANFFKNIEVFQRAKEINEEIEFLRRENSALSAEISLLKEIKKENEVLQKAFDNEIKKNHNLVFSRVVGRNFNSNRITISYNESIKVGNPAITPEGVLVGMVEEIDENFAHIKLIIDEKSSFDAIVQNEQRPIGVLRGRGKDGLFLDFLQKDKGVKFGDFVVMAPKEEYSTTSVYIGRIAEIKESDVEAFVEAKIWQGVDYRYLDHLFIIND